MGIDRFKQQKISTNVCMLLFGLKQPYSCLYFTLWSLVNYFDDLPTFAVEINMSISYLLLTSCCFGNGSRHRDYKIPCCKLIYNTLCHKTSAIKLQYQSLGQNKTQINLILECSLMNDVTMIWQDVLMIHIPKKNLHL